MGKTSAKEKIIESSIELFSKRNFDEVSILEICKKAGISNAAFYRHFKNKDEIFKILLEKTIHDLDLNLTECTGDCSDMREGLKGFIRGNFINARELEPLIRIYREGQYKFVEYEKKLRENAYLKHLRRIFRRDIDTFQYLFIMSGIRYLSVYNVTNRMNYHRDEVIDFMCRVTFRGFFNHSNLDMENFRDGTLSFKGCREKSISHKEMEATDGISWENMGASADEEGSLKKKLIEGGAYLFGKKGYYNTGINEITERVGIATGSFYSYFPSKERFFNGIIEDIVGELEEFLKENVGSFQYPCENILWYFFLIKEFFRGQEHKYEALRTSEFVDGKLIKRYYRILEKYFLKSIKNLDYTLEQKEIMAKIFIGMSHYMGIEYFFTKNFRDFPNFVENMQKLLTEGMELQNEQKEIPYLAGYEEPLEVSNLSQISNLA